MKVIDLLNKIANEEEVPKHIKWSGIIFKYDKYELDYFNSDNFSLFRHDDDYNVTKMLNDEVENLEEKEIPEKLSTWFSVETKQSKELNKEYINTNFENMYEKINEIIDCLYYLKSKGDE